MVPFWRLPDNKRRRDPNGPREANGVTCAFAYPIQGANAVVTMRAMARLDRALIKQRIDGGLVIFNHDEFVLETREADAERAGALLKEAMESAYLDMFPAARLKGLVEVHTGLTWAGTKTKKAAPEAQAPATHGGLWGSPPEPRLEPVAEAAVSCDVPRTRSPFISRAAPLEALDLYCCAGGATAGLQRAGFRVTGVDMAPQPNYCGDAFVQADALDYLATADLSRFAFIWASPPCQRFTALKHAPGAKGDAHLDLIAPTREALKRIGLPYVIENVEGAPLIEPFTLCGTMFDLVTPGGVFEIQRHRIFEASFPVSAPQCNHPLPVCGVCGGHFRDRRRAAGPNYRSSSNIPREHGLAAMQTPWMTVSEVSECIPPA
jgi:DNA (cytosine-5)-methyltransferase 1